MISFTGLFSTCVSSANLTVLASLTCLAGTGFSSVVLPNLALDNKFSIHSVNKNISL